MTSAERTNRTLTRMLNRVRSVVAPPPDLSISKWADEFLYLPRSVAAEPGKYYTSRMPWQKEMLEQSYMCNFVTFLMLGDIASKHHRIVHGGSPLVGPFTLYSQELDFA